ncbi:unnamed protein product [Dicrocoelium dendriticum]|nr:unnamed protein product [Dicrocoelium dendriticum]
MRTCLLTYGPAAHASDHFTYTELLPIPRHFGSPNLNQTVSNTLNFSAHSSTHSRVPLPAFHVPVENVSGNELRRRKVYHRPEPSCQLLCKGRWKDALVPPSSRRLPSSDIGPILKWSCRKQCELCKMSKSEINPAHANEEKKRSDNRIGDHLDTRQSSKEM